MKLILEEQKIRIRITPEEADALTNENILQQNFILPDKSVLNFEISPCKFPKKVEKNENRICIFVDFMQLKDLQMSSKTGILLTSEPIPVSIEIDIKNFKSTKQ